MKKTNLDIGCQVFSDKIWIVAEITIMINQKKGERI